MGKKYIVEVKKNETLYKAATRESDGTAYVCSAIGTPYTEPDLEQIKADWYKAGREAERVRQPDLEQVMKEAYDKGMDEAEMLAYKLYSPKIDEAYQRGLNDAWDAARKIANMPYGEEEKAFGSGGWAFIVKHTASEAIEKIRQYEQEKEEQKQLQVGDEVKLKRCDIYAVYMGGVNGSNERNVYLCFNDGSCGPHSKSEIERKTGRHFPEIATILEKMRGEQDG